MSKRVALLSCMQSVQSILFPWERIISINLQLNAKVLLKANTSQFCLSIVFS